MSVLTVAQTDFKVLEAGYSFAVKAGTSGLLETGGVATGGGGGGAVVLAGLLLLPPPPQAVRNAQLAADTKSNLIEFLIIAPYTFFPEFKMNDEKTQKQRQV